MAEGAAIGLGKRIVSDWRLMVLALIVILIVAWQWKRNIYPFIQRTLQPRDIDLEEGETWDIKEARKTEIEAIARAPRGWGTIVRYTLGH